MSLHPTHPVHYIINARAEAVNREYTLPPKEAYHSVLLNYELLTYNQKYGELPADRLYLINASITGLLLNFKIKSNG